VSESHGVKSKAAPVTTVSEEEESDAIGDPTLGTNIFDCGLSVAKVLRKTPPEPVAHI
jgi:hypothetical protein